MISLIPYLVLLIGFAITAQAYSKFETACTTPANFPTNFVSSPDTRGTLDILWSSLFTIVACTWTIQHLNIPKQRTRQLKKGWAHAFWCDMTLTLKGFLRNLKWMLITIVAPDFILGKAIIDLWLAWSMREIMKPYAEEDQVEWILSHRFYANMGGFVAIEEARPRIKTALPESPLQRCRWERPIL